MIGSYFTELNGQKYLFYLVCLVYVICTSVVVIIEPFLSLPCVEEHKSELEFENVLFRYSICDYLRHPELLFLTRAECERGRHLLSAVFFGSLIGYERRSSDRPAGIRTMALVSLGSALFTINSTFGFLEGPMVSTTVCWSLIHAGRRRRLSVGEIVRGLWTYRIYSSSQAHNLPQRIRPISSFRINYVKRVTNRTRNKSRGILVEFQPQYPREWVSWVLVWLSSLVKKIL